MCSLWLRQYGEASLKNDKSLHLLINRDLCRNQEYSIKVYLSVLLTPHIFEMNSRLRTANARAARATDHARSLALHLGSEQFEAIILRAQLHNAVARGEALEVENETLKAENEALKAQSAGFERQAHYQYARHTYYMFKDLDNHRKRKAAEAELSEALEATTDALKKAAK